MNKMLGFYELKNSDLPTIPWSEYNDEVSFDTRCLWTVRTAVIEGDDLNLPRLVGGDALEAKRFATEQYNQLAKSGMVIYYPYFIAEKSGTLNVYFDKYIIEAVKADLWNLVTYSEREVTIQNVNGKVFVDGNKDFFCADELNELANYVSKVRVMFRDYLLEGKSILLEWSYAYNCNSKKELIGDKYLVFYEVRTV